MSRHLNLPTTLHVVAGLHPNAGGPSQLVVQLTDVLATQQIRVFLITQSMPGTPTIPSSNHVVQRINTESKSVFFKWLGLPARHALKKFFPKQTPLLIHSHGLWLPINHWASSYARRNGLPLIIHPHGMLHPWALEHKAFKKKCAMVLFQRRDITSAKVLIATSHDEYRYIRQMGFKQPVAIIANGVHQPSASAIEVSHKQPSEKKTALFLARIHPVKGLLNLIQAWSIIQPAGWRLQIVGPDEGGYLAKVIAAIKQVGIDEHVEYLGAVYGRDKTIVYQNADLFILPSFTENFGMAIAEALSYGLPVITTRGAPWADLEIYRCGWWIDVGVEPLATALQQATSLSDNERQAMGKRGRNYVQRYNWGEIARQTVEVYHWVLDQGSLPKCIHMD